MVTPCIECTDWFYCGILLIQNVANIQSFNAFIGEFDILKRTVSNVSVYSSNLTALNSLFEEISKLIPWSRCTVKCKVKVDSYKACSRFNGREYIFVQIWWRPNCKFTNDKSSSNAASRISGVLYFLESWLRCLLYPNFFIIVEILGSIWQFFTILRMINQNFYGACSSRETKHRLNQTRNVYQHSKHNVGVGSCFKGDNVAEAKKKKKKMWIFDHGCVI